MEDEAQKAAIRTFPLIQLAQKWNARTIYTTTRATKLWCAKLVVRELKEALKEAEEVVKSLE